MKDTAEFLGRPIFSLQTMLRQIAHRDSRVPMLIPNGIYGPDTRRAVTAVQQLSALPQTGVTDLDTWNTIVSLFNKSLAQQAPPAILPVWDPGQTVQAGESNAHLYTVQAMLAVLSNYFREIRTPAVTGILDRITSEGLRHIQRGAELPENGLLDSLTLHALSDLYRITLGNGRSPYSIG